MNIFSLEINEGIYSGSRIHSLYHSGLQRSQFGSLIKKYFFFLVVTMWKDIVLHIEKTKISKSWCYPKSQVKF